MGAKGGVPKLKSAAHNLDPLLLAAVVAPQARRQIRVQEEIRAREIETGFRQLALRKEQINLAMSVLVKLFAMAYLVAVLLLAPLLLAPTGLFAAAYLWRRER